MKKLKNILLFTTGLMLLANLSIAQCNYSIEVTHEILEGKGIIKAKIINVSEYKCILYAYENGKKIEISQKSGIADNVSFNNLSLNRYYRLEFSFSNKDNLLCTSWVSELININD